MQQSKYSLFLFVCYASLASLFFFHYLISTSKIKENSFIKLTTVDECDPKETFSITTPPRSRRGRYSFSLIAPFDTYHIMLSVKQSGIKYYFLNLLYDSTLEWTPVSRVTGEHYLIDQWVGYVIYIQIKFYYAIHVTVHKYVLLNPFFLTLFLKSFNLIMKCLTHFLFLIWCGDLFQKYITRLAKKKKNLIAK